MTAIPKSGKDLASFNSQMDLSTKAKHKMSSTMEEVE